MPDAPIDLLLEGYRLQTLGRREDAERNYRRVLSGNPADVHALNLLGILCLESQRADEAVQLITRAVAQTPDDAETLANLALALKDTGRLKEAAEALQLSLRYSPRNPVALNNLGNILSALHRDAEAVACFRDALRIQPDYADCLINLATALRKQDQLTGALAAASHAVALKPEAAEAHNSLGEVLSKQTRHEEAVISFRTAIRLRPAFTDALINLSAALKETGDIAGAEGILREVIERDPRSAAAHNSLGMLLEQSGDAAGATRQFRQAVAVGPRYAQAWYQLAQLKDAALNAEEINTIRELFEDPVTLAEQRAPLAFALACIHERAKDYAGSFRYLAIAQAIKAKESAYDDPKVADYYGRIRQVFASIVEPRGVPLSCESPQPVFILGMPRSGTTLTEQVLASHPDIAGAGELSLMEDTVNEAARGMGRRFPEGVLNLTGEQRTSLAEYYLSRLKRRATSARVIVDKTPMNFQYIGFIATILPGARIIHCRRHPLDNCLSIFKLPFEDSHSYAHGLESLGRYYTRYAELMAHWARVVPGRMIEVQYEDLVADLESQSRRLLDFLGLPFDAAVLQFHKSRRLVKTPSTSQVRQPIYRDSVAAWRRYEAQLQPLIAALAPVLSAGS